MPTAAAAGQKSLSLTIIWYTPVITTTITTTRKFAFYYLFMFGHSFSMIAVDGGRAGLTGLHLVIASNGNNTAKSESMFEIGW
jgi:hypothetical protein